MGIFPGKNSVQCTGFCALNTVNTLPLRCWLRCYRRSWRYSSWHRSWCSSRWIEVNAEIVEGLEGLHSASRTQVGAFNSIAWLDEWQFGREAQICRKDDALP